MNRNTNDVLQQALMQQGQQAPSPAGQPMSTPPTPEEQSEDNSLQGIINAGEEMKEEKTSSLKEIDADLLKKILMSGDNTNGMFTPDEEKDKDGEPLHQEDETELKVKGAPDMLGKYTKDFAKDLMENPQDYTVHTARGKMTLEEAIAKGYDPRTKAFTREVTMKKARQALDESLSEHDREGVRRMFSPNQEEEEELKATTPEGETPAVPTPSDNPEMAAVTPNPQGDVLSQAMMQQAQPQPAVQPQGGMPAGLEQLLGQGGNQ